MTCDKTTEINSWQWHPFEYEINWPTAVVSRSLFLHFPSDCDQHNMFPNLLSNCHTARTLHPVLLHRNRGNHSVIILHKLLLQYSVASRWMSPIRKYMGQIEEMLLFTNCNSNKLLFLKLEKERTCCYLLFGESVRILFSRRVDEETVGINWRFTLRSLISCWTSDWNGCAGHHRRVLVFVQLSLLWWITTNKV